MMSQVSLADFCSLPKWGWAVSLADWKYKMLILSFLILPNRDAFVIQIIIKTCSVTISYPRPPQNISSVFIVPLAWLFDLSYLALFWFDFSRPLPMDGCPLHNDKEEVYHDLLKGESEHDTPISQTTLWVV